MPFVFKRLALFMSIAAGLAADKPPAFHAPPVSSLPHRQTNGQVTIGAEPYTAGDKVKSAFGKLSPYQYGVLPVLVVIQNDSSQTLRLKGMKAEYVGGNNRAEAIPPKDVRYVNGPRQPDVTPFPPKLRRGKNPLAAWEIEGRAFAAEMLPAGNSASGFFYFQTGLQHDSTILLSGITEAATGRELLFFEVPLQ